MYWPYGSPRVYLYNETPSLRSRKVSDDEDGNSVDGGDGTGRQPSSDEVSSAEIIDLQGSRSGHVFTTITAASVHVWQTRVSELLVSFLGQWIETDVYLAYGVACYFHALRVVFEDIRSQ